MSQIPMYVPWLPECFSFPRCEEAVIVSAEATISIATPLTITPSLQKQKTFWHSQNNAWSLPKHKRGAGD